jgi:hypothetical protein
LEKDCTTPYGSRTSSCSTVESSKMLCFSQVGVMHSFVPGDVYQQLHHAIRHMHQQLQHKQCLWIMGTC